MDLNSKAEAVKAKMMAEQERSGCGQSADGRVRGLYPSPPDPLDNQATAWRLYGAFLETARVARDAFWTAGIEMPMPLAAICAMRSETKPQE